MKQIQIQVEMECNIYKFTDIWKDHRTIKNNYFILKYPIKNWRQEYKYISKKEILEKIENDLIENNFIN